MTEQTTCLFETVIARSPLRTVPCVNPAIGEAVDHNGEDVRGYAARIPVCREHADEWYAMGREVAWAYQSAGDAVVWETCRERECRTIAALLATRQANMLGERYSDGARSAKRQHDAEGCERFRAGFVPAAVLFGQ